MNAALEAVLRHPGIWRGTQCAQSVGETVPTGFAELDGLLPGGGWPRGALTEVLAERGGIGELRLLLPALIRLSREGDWLLWVAPPHVPYAPALAAAGLDLERLWLAQAPTPEDAWWAAEQALRSGACAAVLAWLPTPDDRRLRRLQLAAETGRAWGVLFRPLSAVREHSPAALRLHLAPAAKGLAVHILKRRGGTLDRPVLVALPRAGGVQAEPSRTPDSALVACEPKV